MQMLAGFKSQHSYNGLAIVDYFIAGARLCELVAVVSQPASTSIGTPRFSHALCATLMCAEVRMPQKPPPQQWRVDGGFP